MSGRNGRPLWVDLDDRNFVMLHRVLLADDRADVFHVGVLFTLAAYGDRRTGESHVSARKIGRLLYADPRTVFAKLADLEAWGYIDKVADPSGTKGATYRLIPYLEPPPSGASDAPLETVDNSVDDPATGASDAPQAPGPPDASGASDRASGASDRASGASDRASGASHLHDLEGLEDQEDGLKQCSTDQEAADRAHAGSRFANAAQRAEPASTEPDRRDELWARAANYRRALDRPLPDADRERIAELLEQTVAELAALKRDEPDGQAGAA